MRVSLLYFTFIYLSFQFQIQISQSLQLWRRGTGTGTETETETAIEATRVGDPVCLEPKLRGPCRARVPRYFFNTESNTCELFHYGGCSGNGNNFDTMEACNGKCTVTVDVKAQSRMEQQALGTESICSGPAEEGRSCEGILQRWTFNTSTQQCTPFLYGGCGGTRNNFQKLIDCQLTCGDRSSCSLPTDPGFCNGIQKYWSFNSERNACGEFDYGGCGGNRNRFNTQRQCEQLCVTALSSAKASQQQQLLITNQNCEGVRCPGGVSHYKELNCKPIYDDGACCPTRYDCPERVVSKNGTQCVYKNKVFNVGESIRSADSGSGCRAGCTCTESGINCAHVECPDVFGYYPKEDCRIGLYKAGDCCAYDYACGNETRICEFEGNTFLEDERIYPKEEPCLRCTCKPGFNGTLSEEFCEKIDCGFQIWYSHELERGCTPVYFQNRDSQIGCCPISWKCPEDYENSLLVPTTSLPISPNQSELISPDPAGSGNGTENGSDTDKDKDKDKEGELVEQVPLPNNATYNETSISSRIQDNSQVSTALDNQVVGLGSGDKCSEPMERGDCKADRLRYFYNTTSNQCQQFSYTGCRGNENNFVTLTQCKRSCERSDMDLRSRFATVSIALALLPEKESDPCTLPVSPGRCRAFFPRFFFNVERNECQLFIFGGCHRNGNNFFTRESCQATCTKTYPNVCEGKPLDLERNCGGGSNVTKYYYDPDIGYCQRFISTGCTGSNVFNRLSECDSVCAGGKSWIPRQRYAGPTIPDAKPSEDTLSEKDKRCYLEKKTGACNGHIPSHYFHVESKSCKPFIYGGCFGNLNRFPTLDSCRTLCEPEGGAAIAIVASASGSGNADGSFISFDEHDRPQVEDPNVFRGPESESESSQAQRPLTQQQQLLQTPIHKPNLQKEEVEVEVEAPNFIFARMGPVQSQQQLPTNNIRIARVPLKISSSSEESNQKKVVASSVEETLQLESDENLQQKQTISDENENEEGAEHSNVGGTGDGEDEGSFNEPQVEDPVLLHGDRQNQREDQNTDQDTDQDEDDSFSRPQVEDPSLMFGGSEEVGDFTTSTVSASAVGAKESDTETIEGQVGGAINFGNQQVRKVRGQDQENSLLMTRQRSNDSVPIPISSSSSAGKSGRMYGLRNNGKEVCKEELNFGNCNQTILRFHWDTLSRECRPFNFTGCGGNRNRFLGESACRQVCDEHSEDVVSSLYCLFGSRVIPFGSHLNEDTEKCGFEFCTCSVPPSLTCTVTSCDQG